MTAHPPILPGIAELAESYDAYIVDLWGVVHNGHAPLPGVVDALYRLRDRGAVVCLLSNAPRRAQTVVARLRDIGIPDDAYDAIVTSGEATHQALAERPDTFHQTLGRHCFHIGPSRDRDLYEGLDITIVADADQASFVLNSGIDQPDETLADYESHLTAALNRDLPMICANPDLVVMIGDLRSLCAGTFAMWYEERGGRVAYHGKPHRPVYQRCLDLIRACQSNGGSDADARQPRVLAVGDSVRTDIAGARLAGLDSLLVTGAGIHTDALACDASGWPSQDALRALLSDYPVAPNYVAPYLNWA